MLLVNDNKKCALNPYAESFIPMRSTHYTTNTENENNVIPTHMENSNKTMISNTCHLVQNFSTSDFYLCSGHDTNNELEHLEKNSIASTSPKEICKNLGNSVLSNVLNITTGTCEISTSAPLEVDPEEKHQFHGCLTMLPYVKLFCYIFSVFLYSCICTPFGSSHDNCNINVNNAKRSPA